jgi:hypothetical protein
MPSVNVPDIAALRLVSSDAGSAHVEGFAKPGDGGGGNFYWDHNNPYLLDDNIGIVITSSLTRSGRWRREGFQRLPTSNQYTSLIETVPAEGINVKWFGAIGDGYVNDTPAIQNAVNAASKIADGLWFATNETVPSVVTVALPSGVYNITGSVNTTSGIEIPGSITLMGLGGSVACVLQTSNPNIPIIRTGMAWCTIQGITFKGGLHHVAMYGPSSQYGLFSPTAFGNVLSIIKDCCFFYPVGPAIWQDLGPTAAIAAGSNGAMLPQPTIQVDTTANFPPTGNIGILFADGSSQSVSYAGVTPTSFTGCSGGAGALETGMLVYPATAGSSPIPTNYRTFETTLRVLDFQFAGAHLFWGSGDSVIFSQGHIAWDFTNTVTSTDGLPLGIFNSCDTLYVDHVTAFGNAPRQPARPAIFVGTNGMSMTATAWAQNDGITFVRARYKANKYQGAGRHPVSMPADGGTLVLKVNNAVLVCSYGAFWLEVYDNFPASISLKNWYSGNDFFNTNGIWVDQAALAASSIFTRQKAAMSLDIDGIREFPNVRQIYTGFDPRASEAPAIARSTEITSEFILARVDDPEDDVDNTFQENLFNNPTVDGTAVGFAMIGGSTSTDRSSGYPVTLWTAGPTTASSPVQVIIPFASLMPNNLPSGVYCFSFYWKVNWDQDLWIQVGPTDGQTGANAIKHFTSDASYQRFWIPFYYPDNGASWTVWITSYGVPVRVVPWAPNTPYAAGDRVTNGGNVYLSTQTGNSGGGGGPSGTAPNIVDGGCTWDYVGPGGTFTPECALGLMMLNKGRTPAPYVFPLNADANTNFGTVPRIYYGTAAPTSGSYVVGDILYNTAPASGAYIGWVCTVAGSPGTWQGFGLIA